MRQLQHDLFQRSRCRTTPTLLVARLLGWLCLLAAEAAHADPTDRCIRLPSCATGPAVVPTTAFEPLEPLETIDAPWPEPPGPEGWPEALTWQAPLPADDHS